MRSRMLTIPPPVSLRDAERGLSMQDAIEALEELDSELDGFIEKVNKVIEKLTPSKKKKYGDNTNT